MPARRRSLMLNELPSQNNLTLYYMPFFQWAHFLLNLTRVSTSTMQLQSMFQFGISFSDLTFANPTSMDSWLVILTEITLKLNNICHRTIFTNWMVTIVPFFLCWLWWICHVSDRNWLKIRQPSQFFSKFQIFSSQKVQTYYLPFSSCYYFIK